MKTNWRKSLETIISVLLGNVFLAVAVAAFIVPHGIIMGGATGVALTINHYVDGNLSVVIFIVNMVLFVLGTFVLGKKFALTTLISTIVYPVSLSVVQAVPGITRLTENVMLASLYGGALLGIGIGLVVRVGSSTGGTDILALVFHKWFHLAVAVFMYLVDFTVLLCQAFFSTPEQILYGIIMLVIESIVLDRVMVMGQSQIQVLVMSSKYDEIRRRLLDELEAGVTMLHIESGYTNREGKGILCVIPPRKQFAAKEIIYAVDPEAFLTITQVWEVQGRGFSFERRMGAKQAR